MNNQITPDYLFKRLGEQMIQIEILSEQLKQIQLELEELKKDKEV